jgi:hypothetical protein
MEELAGTKCRPLSFPEAGAGKENKNRCCLNRFRRISCELLVLPVGALTRSRQWICTHAMSWESLDKSTESPVELIKR